MAFWSQVENVPVEQGDLLHNISVGVIDRSFPDVTTIGVEEGDFIVLSQSCDLLAQKLDFGLVAPIFSILDFSAGQTHPLNKSNLNEIRKGRREHLHLLPPLDGHSWVEQCLIVDFRRVHSLPVNYLANLAFKSGPRPRLISPYLENFSQSFARVFMRVALPEDIPEFK